MRNILLILKVLEGTLQKPLTILHVFLGFVWLWVFSGDYNELLKAMNNTERLIFQRLLPLYLPQKTYRESPRPSAILSFHPLPGYPGE